MSSHAGSEMLQVNRELLRLRAEPTLISLLLRPFSHPAVTSRSPELALIVQTGTVGSRLSRQRHHGGGLFGRNRRDPVKCGSS